MTGALTASSPAGRGTSTQVGNGRQPLRTAWRLQVAGSAAARRRSLGLGRGLVRDVQRLVTATEQQGRGLANVAPVRLRRMTAFGRRSGPGTGRPCRSRCRGRRTAGPNNRLGIKRWKIAERRFAIEGVAHDPACGSAARHRTLRRRGAAGRRAGSRVEPVVLGVWGSGRRSPTGRARHDARARR